MKPILPGTPPALVRRAVDLAELFATAHAAHDAGQQAERASLEHYCQAGLALLQAKEQAGHGQWLQVLKERSRIPQQRASEYMRLAAGWDKLPPDGSFTLRQALRLIAGEPQEGAAEKTLAQLETQISAGLARVIECKRMELLLYRDVLGDDGFRQYVVDLLVKDRMPRQEALGVANRIMSKHFPDEKDVEAYSFAWLADYLRQNGVDPERLEGEQ